MRKVELRLFGAFRKASEKPTLELWVPDPSTVRDFKALIAAAVAERPGAGSLAALVGQSAIASESEILLDDHELPRTGALAILPPVCGG